MANKLNLLTAEQYAKNFAKIICDDFFSDDDTIGGTQILNLTEIRQINLLVIKNLYEKWETETQKIRSPFFDFQHPEVVEAFNDFKNILSRHIAVKQEQFEPLVTNATRESLVLLLAPKDYYHALLRDLPNFQLTHDWIKSVSKYLPTNNWVLQQLGNQLGEKSYVFANEAIAWLDDIFKEGKEDESDKTLMLYDKVLSLPNNLEEKEETIFPPVQPEETKPKKVLSFFDQEVVDLSRTIQNKIETPKTETPPILPEPTPVEPIFVSPVVDVEKKIEEIKSMIQETAKVEEIPMVAAPQIETIAIEVKKNTEETRLNEHLNQDQKTLNDHSQANGRNTLLDYHQKSRIESIRGAISLNQRFLFINNLFHGNVEAFSHALEELETCTSFAEAREVMLKKFVPRYLWDVTSAEAEEFIDIVKRRFS